MLSPFLIVGLGGSGGHTLRVLRKDLRERLDRVGYDKPLPTAWQFLHIDVPAFQDSVGPGLPDPMPPDSYEPLVTAGVTYQIVDRAVVRDRPLDTPEMRAVMGWRPNPLRVAVGVENGAGQYRALGRMITISQYPRIAEAVRQRALALSGAEVTAELGEVAESLGIKPEATIPGKTVIVVSSVSGGSGAGSLIDVCDIIRSLGEPWANESVGILYAPDVFDPLPEGARKGVRPNALATLSELLAGFWGDGVGEESASLLSRAGVPAGLLRRSGPRYMIAVGLRNDKIAFERQADVYAAMGTALSAWLTSERLQDAMRAYTQANWPSAASAGTDNLPIKSPGMENPLSAIGFSRLMLGRQRFRRYASQWLARRSMDVLLRKHELERDPDDKRPSPALVKEQAARNWVRFLTQTQLHEETLEHDDVIDAIRPADERYAAMARVRTAIGSAFDAITGRGRRRKRDLVEQAVVDTAQQHHATFLVDDSGHVMRRVRAWIDQTTARLDAVAAATAGEVGLPVTLELFAWLEDSLERAASELAAEAERYAGWAAQARNEIPGTIGTAREILLESEEVERAVDLAVQALYNEAEGRMRGVASRLLTDFRQSYLKPLRKGLKDALERLEVAEQPGPNGEPAPSASWPTADMVPTSFRPRANEFLVVDHRAYPELFRQLLRDSVEASADDTAVDLAVSAVVLGEDPTAPLAEGLPPTVERRAEWVPEDLSMQPPGSARAPRKARIEFHLADADLLARADRWVGDDNRRIGQYCAESFAEHLDPDAPHVGPKEHNDRLRDFRGKLSAAVDVAAPLVRVNTNALSAVHQKSQPEYEYLFSELPFHEGSPARQAVLGVLEEKDVGTGNAEDAFVDTGRQETIDIFATFAEPYELAVFESLTRPILTDWEVRRSDTNVRAEFWRWRRARPLAEFIPVSPGVREALVRGWVTAILLDQLVIEDQAVRIFEPAVDPGANGRYLPFPSPMLVPAVEAHDYLPAVLKSLPIALLYVTTLGLQAVAAYTRLRQLGEAADGSLADYPVMNRELSDWVRTGRRPRGHPRPDDGTTADERRRALVQRLEDLQGRYEAVFRQALDSGDVYGVPRALDLQADIIAAMEDLRVSLQSRVEHGTELM